MSEKEAEPGLGLAITCFILGVLSLVLSIVVVGGILALVGLILGLVHLKGGRLLRKLTIAGVVLSVIGLAASAGLGFFYYKTYRHFRAVFDDHERDVGVSPEAWKGVLAPELTVTTMDGNTLHLADLRGKRVVLDFWATWCPPCVKEIPHFIQLAGETSRDELVIVGISSEPKEKLEQFVTAKGINYPIAIGEDLPSPYADIRSIPTTFFIDRNGVIQEVFVGYHDYDVLRDAALAKDVEGEPRPPPDLEVSGLQEPGVPNLLLQQWSVRIPGGGAICTGDWDGDGTDEILAGGHGTIQVIDLKGQVQTSLQVPESLTQFEVGRHATGGPRLLGYSNWGKSVIVLGSAGKPAWEYATPTGVDGAHWGDLDGDGSDELVVGMNGGGGLHALSPEGSVLWEVKNIGNVWNQAVVSPPRAPGDRLVFATEAGGSIHVYDSKGKRLRVLRPQGRYFAQMSASVLDDAGSVQVIGLGDGQVIALDPQGEIAWSTPGIKNHGAWRSTTFAGGDLDGDGRRDWVFHERNGDLCVASADGVRIAALPGAGQLEGFAVAEVRGGAGLLITLSDHTVIAYAVRAGGEPVVDAE